MKTILMLYKIKISQLLSLRKMLALTLFLFGSLFLLWFLFPIIRPSFDARCKMYTVIYLFSLLYMWTMTSFYYSYETSRLDFDHGFHQLLFDRKIKPITCYFVSISVLLVYNLVIQFALFIIVKDVLRWEASMQIMFAAASLIFINYGFLCGALFHRHKTFRMIVLGILFTVFFIVPVLRISPIISGTSILPTLSEVISRVTLSRVYKEVIVPDSLIIFFGIRFFIFSLLNWYLLKQSVKKVTAIEFYRDYQQ